MLKNNFKFRSFLIPKYILGAIAPYILLSLLMLTACRNPIAVVSPQFIELNAPRELGLLDVFSAN